MLHSLVSNGMTTEKELKLIFKFLEAGARTNIKANLDRKDENGNSFEINCIGNNTVYEMVLSLYNDYLACSILDRKDWYINNEH